MRGSAPICMVICMVIFGTIGLFVRNIALSSEELALYRAIMAAVFVGGFLLLRGEKADRAAVKKALGWLIASGVCMGINWILLFDAYAHTTISLATLSYYFAPVIVMAAGPLLLKEKLCFRQKLCFTMSTAGMVLLVGAAGGGSNDWIGVLFGLGAAVFYAGIMLINRFIKGVGGLHRTFFQFVAATAVLLPVVLLRGPLQLGTLQTGGIVNLLIVGIVHTGISYCMYFAAIRTLPAQQTAMLSYIDPLVAVAVSIAPLGIEQLTFWQICGGILILGFTLLNELSIKRSEA